MKKLLLLFLFVLVSQNTYAVKIDIDKGKVHIEYAELTSAYELDYRFKKGCEGTIVEITKTQNSFKTKHHDEGDCSAIFDIKINKAEDLDFEMKLGFLEIESIKSVLKNIAKLDAYVKVGAIMKSTAGIISKRVALLSSEAQYISQDNAVNKPKINLYIEVGAIKL